MTVWQGFPGICVRQGQDSGNARPGSVGVPPLPVMKSGKATVSDIEKTCAELRSEYQDRYSTVLREAIEAGRVRDYLLAMDEPDALDAEQPVPPLFLLTLGRVRRPVSGTHSVMKAGDEYSFSAPVHVGDVITISCSIPPVVHKRGSLGDMFFVTIECSYVNQDGLEVGTSRKKSLVWRG
jgi:hypothetical protein